MSADDGTGARCVLAVARRQRDAQDWALVLQSQGLEAEVLPTRQGFALECAAEDEVRARALLAAWERENRPVPQPEAPPGLPFPWLAMALLSLALLAFFAWTGPDAGGRDWAERGEARAARIVAGEWWRAVTALTLHADRAHVLGNVLAGTLFVGTLCRRFGTGVSLALLLAAGTLGNLANAFYHRAGHSSLGASTAVFAAVGALAADAALRRRAPERVWLTPLGAGLALLAMLGTGQRADVWAHAFGLAAGLALGLPLARRLAAPPGAAWQALCGAAALALLCGAWALALAR